MLIWSKLTKLDMKLQAVYVRVQYEKIYNRQLDFYT